MKFHILYLGLALAFAGCSKSAINEVKTGSGTSASAQTITTYTIKKGDHTSDKSVLKWVATQELNFAVRFDSSAVYRNELPENQFDINKLYGFSDNNSQHHLFSARFGWRWSANALRLFAYVYNTGERQEKELGTVAIGEWIQCSIKVAGQQYRFVLNGQETVLPRSSGTATSSGYLLYPYFGGNEVAPHDIKIEIRTI